MIVLKDIFEVNVQYPESLFNPYNERTKIEKTETLVGNLHDKERYAIRIRNLRQALNHGLVLKKVHRFIKFNQSKKLPKSIH